MEKKNKTTELNLKIDFFDAGFRLGLGFMYSVSVVLGMLIIGVFILKIIFEGLKYFI